LILKFPSADPRAKDAAIIGQKIDHLNKIVEQILDFARTTEPQFAPVNLNEIIEELCLLVRHKLKHQNVQLVRNLDPTLDAVKGEAGQLEQAFLNLILNATEAMPAGGTLTITSRALALPRQAARSTHVAVDFTDTGHGMSPEQRRRAFSSVLSTTKVKGTGLGLAIVARVLETHRGKVKIKSRVGQGTTVSVVLPVDRPAEAAGNKTDPSDA
jgi:signal transduction histidine kinase